MKTSDWQNISYLEKGTEKQQSAIATLKKYKILDSLSPYNPVLVSTVCVELDVDGSDLDIICQHNNLDGFSDSVTGKFKEYPNFKHWLGKSENEEIVISFQADTFEIEIYCAKVPLKEQFAYRHLSMMERTLLIGGDRLRRKVKELEISGLKTEASFAKILGLSDDPFLAFLKLEALNDDQLSKLISKSI